MYGEVSESAVDSQPEEMSTIGKLLGHIVYKNGLKTHLDKVEVIIKMESPKDVIGVKYFLEHMDYYRRFIKSFA